MTTMREQMALTATDLFREDSRVAIVLAEISTDYFRDAFAHDPARAVNVGIMEQTMVGVAAGFAMEGYLPLVHTIAPFLAERALEQIKLDFGYQALEGTFASVGGSYDYTAEGFTHHAPADDHHDDHDHHDHAHEHGHEHHHHHGGHDSNIRAAYVHVLADAMTSVLAIVGLLAGRFYGWVFMDPLMALIGVGVILSWSFGLIRMSGTVLLDMVPDRHLAGAIRKRLEIDGDRVSDLHLWRLGPGHAGLIAAVVSDRPQAPSVYKHRLDGIAGLSHVTIEVHACEDHKRQAA